MDSIAIVERFWSEVWQQPQNPEAIDQMVRKDFVITSGGRDIVGREAFKAWVIAFQARIHDLQFESIETFQKPGREPCCVPVEDHWAQQRFLGHGGQ